MNGGGVEKMKIEFKSWIHLHSSVFFSHAKIHKIYIILCHGVGCDKSRNQICHIEHGVCVFGGVVKRSDTIVYACKMYFAPPIPLSTLQSWICEHWAQQKLCLIYFYESIWLWLTVLFFGETMFSTWCSHPARTHHPLPIFTFHNLMACDE